MSENTILNKLEGLTEKYQEIGRQLSDPAVMTDMKRYVALNKEYKELEPIVKACAGYKTLLNDLNSAKALLTVEKDEEMREMAKQEIEQLEGKIPAVEEEIKLLLIPADPQDSKNAILEIRAGTGGDESALFAGELFRMYSRYAERQRWRVETLSANVSELGGYREIICRVTGANVYARLKFESGAHRVQRVPETETQGRVHTSACTVAVMPEADEVGEVRLNPAELRIDTFRAAGAGGQHINKTDSAVRVTHLPTGIVAECQDSRSQHQNKASALRVLATRIRDAQLRAQQTREAATRKSLVGSGDRSERIRTYNFPQGRITDHRINLTLYKIAAIMEGDLDEIIGALTTERQMEQLAALAEEACVPRGEDAP
jgi:peptide chain release factor 1